jgi:hypothetical protein
MTTSYYPTNYKIGIDDVNWPTFQQVTNST